MTSTTKIKKKLIEVAIPLEAINAAAGVENNIHTGLPANLHTWWSRKPLGVARAVLFASLVNDPSEDFDSEQEEEAYRAHLFRIIERLADVNAGTDQEVLDQAKAEIAKSNDGKMPSFWDPFCGGGSLPLEALRLGLEPIATDLNPVAVFITRVLISLAPKYYDQEPINPNSSKAELVSGRSPYEGLKDDLLYYGEKVGSVLSKELQSLYPGFSRQDAAGQIEPSPIAWIWARTVECPNPSCRAHAPLVNKFWLSTHKGNEAFVEPIYEGPGVRKFKFEIRRSGQPKEGTVSRAGAVCLACSNPISFDHVRSEGVAGRVGHQMMAMVADGPRSRVYLAPTTEQEAAANIEAPANAPESALPGSALGFRVQKYGLTRHRDLFTNRQLVALSCLADAISGIREEVLTASGGDKGYADLIQAFLALSLSRVAQTNNTLVRWLVRTSGTSKGTPAFDRQIVSMVWEFSEGNILGSSVGSWNAAIRNPLTALKCLPEGGQVGKAVQANASENDLGVTDAVISTDPPYFDAIGYADLSDFFYIWLRRAVGEAHQDLFGTLLAPKEEDLSAALGRNDVSRQLATEQFLERLSAAFRKMHDASSENIPVTIYYAFKQSESGDDTGDKGKSQSSGWSTLLESVIQAGFQITGTWPLRTESVTRLRAIGSNALATSILLVCRKKVATAGVISRAEFLRALKRELPSALAELQAANIAPADMPQSAIGPGMGVFSRHQKVLESDDSPMSVKTALQLINRELDEYLGGIQGEFDADTRFAITWFEQNGMGKGDYGTANSIATARGISVDSVKHAGIVESAAGRVRILTRDELDEDWDPEEDRHLTVWECLQHLVGRHEKDGISHDTAVLLKKISTQAEAVKDLAYCLYDISANKRKDAKEATAYNALIADWTELTKAAAAIHDTSGDRQIRLDI